MVQRRLVVGDMASPGTRGPRRKALFASVLLLTLALLALASPAQKGNTPPTAVITSPSDGTEVLVGETVTFDGSDSMDDDLPNLTYEWNFSGVIVSGRDMAVVQRTFLSPGDVLVILRVIDSGSLDSRAFVTIHVRAENTPPVAVISSPSEGEAFLNGRPIAFDASHSMDPDGGPLVYRWETNRTIDPIGDRVKFTIKLPLGRYKVILFVYDQLGASGRATVNISVVTSLPPVLTQGGVVPEVGPHDLPGGFNFSVTYTDADNDPPVEILVKAGLPGRLGEYAMVPSDPGDLNFKDGRRYHALVPLVTGTHQFVFTCRDRFYACATALLEGPLVYRMDTLEFPSVGATVTVNWTEEGSISAQAVSPPGPGPADVIMISGAIRVSVADGTWSQARIELDYDVGHLADPDTITLLWYDPLRGLWVPVSSQGHDMAARSVEGDLPGDDTALAVFGELSASNENNPPDLEITYDIKDAYIDKVLWFDASASTDPDGTVLLFHWDFTEDGEPGPWVPGSRAFHVYKEPGVHRVVLRAIDGQNEHFLYRNVTIREEQEATPGPVDNPDILFMLASLLVIAFGLAVAYRLHRPKTYDDLFGKAYKEQEADEYSRLFRKLTEEELRGDWESGGEGPDEGEGEEVTEDEEAEDRTEEVQAEETEAAEGQAGAKGIEDETVGRE